MHVIEGCMFEERLVLMSTPFSRMNKYVADNSRFIDLIKVRFLHTMQITNIISHLKEINVEIDRKNNLIHYLQECERVELSEKLSCLKAMVEKVSAELFKVLQLPNGTHSWRINQFICGPELAKFETTSRAGRAFGLEPLKWKTLLQQEMGGEHFNQMMERARSDERTVDFRQLYAYYYQVRNCFGDIPRTVRLGDKGQDIVIRCKAETTDDQFWRMICLEFGFLMSFLTDRCRIEKGNFLLENVVVKKFVLHKRYSFF